MLRPGSTLFATGFALVAALGLLGCDHATDPDGPNLIDRFGDFSVLTELEASQDSVDFAADETVVFEAQFNKQTNWVLEIVGDSSGAVKRIEGFSNGLSADNAVWTGRTTELPLFKAEPVTASLFFPEEEGSDTSRVSLGVQAARVYPGIVVADFEGGDRISVFNPESEFDFNGISREVPAAQGDSFYLLRGTDDVVVNNFFIGTIIIRPPGGAKYFEVPTDIASELYLNFFLRSFGVPNTLPVVEVVVDGVNGAIPLGPDVEFPNVLPAEFAEGWVPYAEAASSFGKFGAGLTDEQTQRITAINVVLISDANSQPTPPLQVEFGIDYLTFTAGGPLEL